MGESANGTTVLYDMTWWQEPEIRVRFVEALGEMLEGMVDRTLSIDPQQQIDRAEEEYRAGKIDSGELLLIREEAERDLEEGRASWSAWGDRSPGDRFAVVNRQWLFEAELRSALRQYE